MQTSNISNSLRLATLDRLDYKGYVNTEADLLQILNNGTSSDKLNPFILPIGSKINCVDNLQDYYWMPLSFVSNRSIDFKFERAIDTSFIYPQGISTPSFNYSGIEFTFIKLKERSIVTNKDTTLGLKLLDNNDNQLMTLKAGNNISLNILNNKTIEITSSGSGGTSNPLEGIIVGNRPIDYVENPRFPLFENYQSFRESFNRGELTFVDRASMLINVDDELTFVPSVFDSIVIRDNSTVSIGTLENSTTKATLKIKGGIVKFNTLESATFERDLDLLETVLISNSSTVTSYGNVNIDRSTIRLTDGSSIFESHGNLSVVNSSIDKFNINGKLALKVDNGVTLNNNTLRGTDIIKIENNESLSDYIIVNNQVIESSGSRPIVNIDDLITETGSLKVYAYNNNTLDTVVINSTKKAEINESNNVGINGGVTNFAKIRSREEALSTLGPNRMFINMSKGEQDSSLHYLDITIPRNG